MDPGCQIYFVKFISAAKKNSLWKNFFEQQNQEKFSEKKISERNLGKNKIGIVSSRSD